MVANDKHTPGPWKSEGTDWINTPAGGYRVVLVNGENFTVAQVQVDEGDGEQAANLSLILAAPEMLAALRAARDILADYADRNEPDQEYWNEGGEGYRTAHEIRAAIAKATQP